MAAQPPPDEEDLLAEALLAPAEAPRDASPPEAVRVPPPAFEAGPLEAENEALRRSLVALARHAHQSDPGHEDVFERCGHPMCRDVRALLPPQVLPAGPAPSPEAPPVPTPPSGPTPPLTPPPTADDSFLDALTEPEPLEPPAASVPPGVDAFTPPSPVAASTPEPPPTGDVQAEDVDDVEPATTHRPPAPRSRGFADAAADAIDRVATSLFGGRRRR